MFKYECPSCHKVIVISINDGIDCPICYSMMELTGVTDSIEDKVEL